MTWRLIPSHPRYEVSVNGQIRNAKTGKLKSQYIGSTGYYMVSFSYNNKSKPQRVHRLIAEAFIPNIEDMPHVNHIDGDKLNNSIENLEWVNHEQNMKHAFSTGLANNTGVNNGMSKLNDKSAKEIKGLLADGLSQCRIAKMFGVSRSAILKIKLKKTWCHV